MKRLIIYFFWDKDGIVDDYIPYMLKAFKPFTAELCMVVNGDINQTGQEKVKPYVDNLLIRPNKGLDAEAYKYALYQYGFDKLKEYDEVLCTNFTYFGPFYPLSELFGSMDARECDWWGLYRWPIANPIYHHIPSYFVAYRKSLLCSPDFEEYWKTMKTISSYAESCWFHEQRQTPYYDARGYKNAVYFENHFKYMDDWNDHWPLKDADKLIANERFPFIKRRNFFLDEYMYRYKNTLERAVHYICQNFDYDFKMISDNILRTANQVLLERSRRKFDKYKFNSEHALFKRKREENARKYQSAVLMREYENLLNRKDV